MSFDDSTFKGLVEVSQRYSDPLRDLNLKTIDLLKSDSFSQAMSAIKASSTLAMTGMENISSSLLQFGDMLKTTMPDWNISAEQVSRSLSSIADQYHQLFSQYDFASLSDQMKIALGQSQLATISQLCLSFETTMIHDLIGCMANVRYEQIPAVFNDAMAKPMMGAADVAVIKTSSIVPIVESELIYPRGFKTSLEKLNKTTAHDISDNGELEYDTKRNVFCTSSNESADSKTLNVICAGIGIAESDEIFTEVELIDFISELSNTPMIAALSITGRKIYDWIGVLFSKEQYTSDFDAELYYHSRSHGKEAMPFSSDQMLKAPYGVPSAGRYNPPGRSHYYFSNTQHGAEAEVKKHLTKDEVIQTVKLKPVKPIRLLDFSDTVQRGATFLRMIRYQLDDLDNKMPRQYLLPCFVADCCKKIGFDGIKYYGTKEYSNYVSWSDNYFVDAGMCE